ncbi:MAG: inositol monophosphatase [Deltaproteobacteria bacterium]|nr:MAG: inositol monophosphatase [Deltaproteobacteria bacterium]
MLDKVSQIGRRAALAAGAVMRLNYLQPHQVIMKGAIDPVTETDLQAQEMIIALIRLHFPDHGFLAEENVEEVAEAGGTGFPACAKPRSAGVPTRGAGVSPADLSPHRWIIDPLDGTVNFAHGFPMFCVSIAFEAEGRLEYGVIYDPLRDELFEAKRGGGAWLNGRPIRVSTTERLDRALVATGFPYDIRERLPETLGRLGRVLGAVQGVRRAGSAALDMCYVACGRFDGFWEENLKPWDTAAGLLIITEAGGRITTFSGGEYDIYSPYILASNGLIHEEMLSRV